eukprot:944034-Ditylum_brightwellii.AAC.1
MQNRRTITPTYVDNIHTLTTYIDTFSGKLEIKTGTGYASLDTESPRKVAPEVSTGFHVGFLCKPPLCRQKLGGRMPSSPPNNGGQSGVTTTPLSAQKTLNLDKTPSIPLKDMHMKKTEQPTVINEYKLKITFIVGENQNVKPHEKFATLLSL